MKKVLAFVLVLSMILGSFGMAFAAAPADVVGKDYEDAVNVLMELGVVDGYKDGTYRPENIVTRAEMATLIVKALGLNDYAAGKSSFADMAGHWADAYVEYASSLGFIAGYADGTFRPNEPVSYDQAITMLVQAVGYKADYLTGGYPGAFVNQAKTLGMLDGVKSGAAGANRGDVATLLFNTLDVSFVRYDKDGAIDYVALSKDVYDTMLFRLAGTDVTTVTKVMTGAEDALVDISGYQGAYAAYYWDKADEEVIAVKEVKSVFLTGDYDATKGEFETEDETYTVESFGYEVEDDKVAPSLFVNGKVQTKKAANEDGKDLVIAAKVSGKKIKAIYSVAKWDGSTVQATATTVKNIEKNDYLNKDAKFPMNDNEEVDYNEFVLLGVEEVGDIEKDDVLTVYVNGKTITKLEVGQEVVEGKISKITSDAKKITVAGKVYEMFDESEFAFEAGDEVELTLTYAGDVFASELLEGEADDYAIVIKTQAAEEEKIDTTDAKIKLFLADGSEKVFVVDTDEIADVTVFEAGAVVQYDTDKDGNVVALEVVTSAAIEADVEVSAKGYLGEDALKIAEDALIFVATTVDTDENDVIVTTLGEDEDYAVTTKAKLLDSEIANVVYIYDEDTDEITFMVIDATSTTEEIYGVVNDKYAVDSEAGYAVEVIIDGEGKTYEMDTKSKYEAVEVGTPGALKVFKFDANGYLETAEAANAKKSVTVAAEDWDNTVVVENGRVKADGLNMLIAEDVIVYVFDAEDEVWTLGDTSDFNDVDDITVVLYQTDADEPEIDYVVVY